MPKRALRQSMLALRRSLAPAEARRASEAIQRSFADSDGFRKSRVVALYAPIRGEVDTGDVLRLALDQGKTVLLPVVCGDELRFIEVTDPAGLRPGSYAIPEPCLTGTAVAPDRADIIVVPGVAFDLAGRRIGYGKGFYDRALHHLEGTGRLVGFCYDFQLVDEIRGEPHDVALDLIVTEKRIIRPLG
ncbi:MULTISPECIES: 5-formyltetrahydrofolate cyclo-ligase [Geobacter]|uniref:5-formyltetrahydrofolate cyclo-ligase n=2 Tax=Geobacter TaxID=28231 RepID=A0A0C1TPR6_9BACT|nr:MULTISPECIES: 5-formyltetrahydrofolate cyclo-ligase [Geobacter]ANA40737.1 5-formyltetrahydrofolate cyclo-ligase [Geobacter anodireducens]KIE42809.1 5-formyltetrahydrofolate cyclo-ligase [Geobacter soli]MBE2889341.1 5-formyltetrahydrofolate cyclo-ligase [Geobacter anodireducens]HMN01904.1 5-formyltetrahydrofolate cyclo-ligase [Geobacter anodireducens]